MRLLLDTHVYLRWLLDHPKLAHGARSQIAAATEVYASSTSIWEATIKVAIGKLDVDLVEVI